MIPLQIGRVWTVWPLPPASSPRARDLIAAGLLEAIAQGRMDRQSSSITAQAIYVLYKVIVEKGFDQMKGAKVLDGLLLREQERLD